MLLKGGSEHSGQLAVPLCVVLKGGSVHSGQVAVPLCVCCTCSHFHALCVLAGSRHLVCFMLMLASLACHPLRIVIGKEAGQRDHERDANAPNQSDKDRRHDHHQHNVVGGRLHEKRPWRNNPAKPQDDNASLACNHSSGPLPALAPERKPHHSRVTILASAASLA
eukprot:jgi/Chlat1/422/Chrsp10S01523